jgi:hypothetical protein
MDSIPDDQSRKALRAVRVRAFQQWHREGYTLDLEEDRDRGMDGLTACLARSTAATNVPFHLYAARYITGNIWKARRHYRTWHQLRPRGRQHADLPDATLLRPPHTFPWARAASAALAEAVQRWVRRLPPAQQRDADHVMAGDRFAGVAARRLRRWVEAQGAAPWR